MIKLYQFESCPFCVKVRTKLDELNLDYQKIEVDPSDKPELIKKANNGVVPVLDDNGSIIVESADIIDYLEKKYS
ncbi:glutaredoxin [Candidatus Peregrinibacteria bacterium]|nr:glutaredoxin [Candidatus Peregrinibacteria bacterium]